ncbi:hypothetical protein ACWBC2_16025 [Salegentibacter agarivorans]
MKDIITYFKVYLGIDLNNPDHPIAQKINSIPISDPTDQKIKEHHLRILGLSLMDIKDNDAEAYEYYLKKIVNNTDISIHGHIFELTQCAHFIKISKENNLEFKLGDPNLDEPDFIVNGFGFETTSSRFSKSSKKNNPGLKLLGKFREKNKKKYAQKDCVLLIDINQMSYHTLKNQKPVKPTITEVREIIKKDSNFGIVLNFVEWIEKKDDNLHFKGMVYSDYGSECDSNLKKMMETYFIKGNHDFGDKLMMSPN